jgi:hypothetical protein
VGSKDAEIEKAFVPLTKREKEIEEIATDWAKRQFYQASLDGKVAADMTEEQYIDSIWEMAVKEGEARWRKLQGFSDEDPSTWDEKLKQKQAVLAKQAESEIAGMMRGFDRKMDDTIDATLDEYEKLIEEEKAWREEQKQNPDSDEDGDNEKK